MTAPSGPTIIELYDDLRVLQHADPGARRMGMTTNAYAVLSSWRALYVDVNFAYLLPLVRDLADEGYEPAGLVFTHGHVAGNGDGVAAFVEEFDIPAFVHPIDARDPGLAALDVEFHDPIGSDLLASFALYAQHFPGHTRGHVVLYWDRHGGVLFAGDAAMGTTIRQDRNGVERLVRPPVSLNIDDEQMRQGWQTFDRSVLGVAPYHGTIYLDRRTDINEIMRPLVRPEPTRGPTG